MRKNTSRPAGSLIAMTLVLLYFLASLILPLTRGESPVDFGLDLAGGMLVTYRPDFSSRSPSYLDVPDDELLALSKEILQSRLYRSLSTTPDVVVRDDQRIVVSLPGRQDAHRVLDLVGRTYQLTLRKVLHEHPADLEDRELFYHQGRYLELEPARFSGDMLDPRAIRVQTGAGPFERAPTVQFRFKPPHDEAFARFTGDNVGRELAILLDDRVEWSGTIESAIPGVGTLRGGYDLQEAQDIAVMLRSGSLPLSLEVESLSAAGPALGQEIRELGWHALWLALAGLAAVIVAAYAHRPWLALAGLLSLACLLSLIAGMVAAFGLSLDLVGIAGIILSVGMGMDAFILVFEALESSRRQFSGKQLAVHFDRIVRGMYSFAGEGRTLFHANATTLIVVLLLLTTERLRSFALMILVGVSASICTIFLTREILRLTRGWLPDLGPDLLRPLRRSRLGVFRLRKVYFAALVLGLLATGLWTWTAGPGPELGSDFRAGTQLVLAGDDDASVRGAIDELRTGQAGVELRAQRLDGGAGVRYLVTAGAPLVADGSGAASTARAFDLRDAGSTLASRGVEIESLHSIDGKLSSRRVATSLSVLAVSFLFLALYFVVFQGPVDRFFAAGKRRAERVASAQPGARLTIWAGVLLAVVADLAVVLMTVVWFGIPINLPIVAALLTIVGYSVNDSVVLWSHVQARWAELASRGETPSALRVVTGSVDRILSRAALTTLSTLVPAIAILSVGLAPLADFAWVILAGTVAGTLSSIFVVGSFAVRALEGGAAPSSRRLAARPAFAEGRPSGG